MGEICVTRIVIQPNASLTRQGAIAFISSLAVIVFVIAAGFARVGMWLVFPFAGLEILLLIFVFRHLLKSGRRKQVIYIDDDMVRVEEGCGGPEHECKFRKPFTSVVFEPAKIRGYPSRLFLRSAGKQVQIGEVLNEDERQALSRHLRQLVCLDSVKHGR